MSENPLPIQRFHFSTYKIHRIALASSPSYLAGKDPVPLPPVEAILPLQKKMKYWGHLTLGNPSKDGLKWSLENMKLCNCKKVLQQEHLMIIQSEALKKG